MPSEPEVIESFRKLIKKVTVFKVGGTVVGYLVPTEELWDAEKKLKEYDAGHRKRGPGGVTL